MRPSEIFASYYASGLPPGCGLFIPRDNDFDVLVMTEEHPASAMVHEKQQAAERFMNARPETYGLVGLGMILH